MTREEAIEVLNGIEEVHGALPEDGNEIDEALSMAIKALEQEPCEDAISRQAVLDFFDELIGECQVILSTKGEEHFSCGKSYFDWYVKQLPSMAIPSAEPQWIPVSERLPQKSEYGDVLVTYIPSAGTLWTTVMIAQYSDLMGIAKPSFHIGEVGKKSFQNITAQVTAWMPLPKRYKPQEGASE